MRRLSTILAVLASLCWALPVHARAADQFFTTSDGVRLHYVDAGPSAAVGRASYASSPVLLFVPGWTMPEWIFQPQIDAFSQRYRVVALDPRGQGESEIAASGYTYDRRGADIDELIRHLGLQHVLLIGWSLGVLDSLAYVHMHGDQALAGLVLIDNSVGEDPPPAPPKHPYHKAPRQTHAAFMASFVKSMFHRPQPAAYLNRLTETALRTPEWAANALLAYAVPRSYWKEAIYSTRKPVLYVVRPGFAGQAGNLAAHHPDTESEVVPDLGHALFVDDPGRFNAMLQAYMARWIGS
jgi:microsomal epoxide hydrolase